MYEAHSEIETLLQHVLGAYQATPLLELPHLAQRTRVGHVLVKAENERALGNFKALGGAVAAARALSRLTRASADPSATRLICASDGNHGLSVAAAARALGVRASIYLPRGLSPERPARIEKQGGEIIWVAGTYDDAVEQAAAAASAGAGILIPDTSNNPYDTAVLDVMAGYGVMTRELREQLGQRCLRPTHVFVQAGVGGLAAAMAEGLGESLQERGQFLVVEPQAAACVALALQWGYPMRLQGDLRTCAEMLSCGLASAPAVEVLLSHGAHSVVVDEEELCEAPVVLREAGGPETTPSGAAGLAGLLHAARSSIMRRRFLLGADAVVLLVITEGSSVRP